MMNKFIEVINDMVEIITGEKLEDPEIKRARGKMGKFLADDKSTEYTNEAWVGGKAPMESPFPTPEPSMKWTRKQINDYCNEFGVLHSEDDNKKQLLEKIEETYPNGL